MIKVRNRVAIFFMKWLYLHTKFTISCTRTYLSFFRFQLSVDELDNYSYTKNEFSREQDYYGNWK